MVLSPSYSLYRYCSLQHSTHSCTDLLIAGLWMSIYQLHGKQVIAMQAFWTRCLLLAVLACHISKCWAEIVWVWHEVYEELPKSLLVLAIVLLVVKHVKVVFILYNTCTCTQSWCCTSSCMVYIDYSFNMSGFLWNTTNGREKGFTPGKCCTWKREKLRQWITRLQLQPSVASYPGSSPENREEPG